MSIDFEEYEDEERQITFPITEDDAIYLRPKLLSIAHRYSRCESTKEDLVQVAYIAMLDGKRKWTSPFVVAQSAMLDWMKLERRRKYPVSKDNYRNRLEIEEVMIDHLEQSEIANFRGLGLSTDQRIVAELYWSKGMDQDVIAKKLKVGQVTVSNWLKSVKEVVREKWLPNGY